MRDVPRDFQMEKQKIFIRNLFFVPVKRDGVNEWFQLYIYSSKKKTHEVILVDTKANRIKELLFILNKLIQHHIKF